ncbi:MAG TPA: DUF92 domain-containing protein [Thermoplasmata archaeon]|nr:DUF92 domain-containing protein [Thermoplasmata archaeon]
MVLSWELAAVGVVATALLAIAAIAAGALTRAAGALATIFGAVIVILAGFPYLALLVLFVLASSLATRYGFQEKKRRNVQEGTAGERGVANVVAHILIPTGLVLLSWSDPSVLPPAGAAFLYACAISFGAADTFASEFGVLSGGARSILTWKPVPAGTNGGVSTLGELWAFVGAATTALFGLGLFTVFVAPQPSAAIMVAGVIGAGFLACQFDSVLGETLENRGFLTKGGTNVLGMLGAVLVGLAILVATGPLA